jgi:hypothetical protein
LKARDESYLANPLGVTYDRTMADFQKAANDHVMRGPRVASVRHSGGFALIGVFAEPEPRSQAIALEDVLLILRGWQDAKQVTYYHLRDSRTRFTCFGFGEIESSDRGYLRIASEEHGFTASLGRADRFSLWDWRDASPETKEVLQESWDLILTAEFAGARSGSVLQLHSLKEPPDEDRGEREKIYAL